MEIETETRPSPPVLQVPGQRPTEIIPGFARRGGAYFLDFLILKLAFIVIYVLAVRLGLFLTSNMLWGHRFQEGVLAFAFWFFTRVTVEYLLYSPILEHLGGTWGKRAVRMRTVRLRDGLRPTLAQTYLRGLIKLLFEGFLIAGVIASMFAGNYLYGFLGWILYLTGFLSIFLSQKGQTIYDRLSGVTVLEDKGEPEAEAGQEQEPYDAIGALFSMDPMAALYRDAGVGLPGRYSEMEEDPKETGEAPRNDNNATEQLP